MWAQELAKHLVGRMRQVLCPVSPAAKSHNKTVGKSLLEIFNARIRAPFEIVYSIDLARKCAESSLDLANLRIGSSILELEQHDMAQQPGRHFGMARRGGFIFGDALALVDMDTAGQKNRPGSQVQKFSDHVSLIPVISLSICLYCLPSGRFYHHYHPASTSNLLVEHLNAWCWDVPKNLQKTLLHFIRKEIQLWN